MISKFHLEQSLEDIRLQTRCNIHLELKIQAPMKIEHCFRYQNYNRKPCFWLLCLDNHSSHRTQIVIVNLLFEIPHQMPPVLLIKAK